MTHSTATPAKPTKEEAEKIVPIVRRELERIGVAEAKIEEPPEGGLVMSAAIPADRTDGLVSELFEQGILIVRLPSGEWGIAVVH